MDEGAWIRVPPRWRDVGVKSRHRGPRRNGWHNVRRYLRLGPSTLRVGMGMNADQRDLSFGRRRPGNRFDIDDARSQRLPPHSSNLQSQWGVVLRKRGVAGMTSAMLQPAGPRIGGGVTPPIKPRVSAGSLFRPPHALGAAAASLSEPNAGRISGHTRSASEGPSESLISVFRPPHSGCSPLSTSATQNICPCRQNICPAAI